MVPLAEAIDGLAGIVRLPLVCDSATLAGDP